MVKPFLQERTKNKISIFSHSESVTKIVSLFPSIHLTVHQSIVCFRPKQWKAAILAEVDAEELPVSYGGTKTDPDGNPNCITMASHDASSNFSLSLRYNAALSNSGKPGWRSSKILLFHK